MSNDSEMAEFDRDNDANENMSINSQNEDESNIDQNIYVEQDPRKQSFTDSCWELQDARNPLKGDMIRMNGLFRLKHATTQKYLAVD
jgi:hypothetical protein